MEIFKTIFPNGMIYIGQSTKKNPNYFGSGVIVTNYIKKNGKGKLKKIILINCLNQEELDKQEEFFIKKFDSTNKKIGYNILHGSSNKFGSGSPMLIEEIKQKSIKNKAEKYKGIPSKLKGTFKSDETRRKMSIAKKNRILSESTKIKMSISKKGRAGGMVGKKHSIETKLKISKKCSERKHTEETKNKMSLIRKGIIKSEEQKNKISLTLKNNHLNKLKL